MDKKCYLTAMALLMALSSCTAKQITPEELQNARMILQQGNNHQAYKLLKELVDKYQPTYELISLHIQAALAVSDLEGLKDYYDGDSQWDFYGQGMWQGAIQDYDESIASFQKALLINPTEQELYYRLGVVQVEAGKNSEALKSFEQARHYGCTNSKLAIREAMAYVGLKRYDEAMAALVAGVQTGLSREDLTNYIDYSFAIVSKRRKISPREMEAVLPIVGELAKADIAIEEALLPLQNLLQRFPESSLLHAALGLYYFKNHEDGKGTAAIKRAIDFDPNDPYPPLVLGEFLLEGQNGPAAMPYLKQAYEANPLDIRVVENLLKCAKITADKQLEQKLLQQLTIIDPLNKDYISQMAVVSQAEGKLDMAIVYYQRVLEQDKKDLPALYGLAAAYFEQARSAKEHNSRRFALDKCHDYLEKLLEYAPEHPQGNALKKAVDNFQK